MSKLNLSKLRLGSKSRPQNVAQKSRPQATISSFFVKNGNTDEDGIINSKAKPNLNKRQGDIFSPGPKEAKRPKLCSSPKESLHQEHNKKLLSTPSPISSSASVSKSLTKLREFSKDSVCKPKHGGESSNASRVMSHADSGLCDGSFEEIRNPNETSSPKESCKNGKGSGNNIWDQFARKSKMDAVGKYSRRAKLDFKSPNSRTKTQHTPLELQFLEVKSKYPDAVLFVECGYKYRFFGDDAEIAAKELNIMCSLDHNFMTASIPVHRLHVHVKRLVSKGYKVGVVKQTETAALKAAGGNKSKVFTRELQALYTKATLVGEDMKSHTEHEDVDDAGPLEMSGGYLMCLYEVSSKKRPVSKASTNRGKIVYGLVAVQPSSGDIIYDEFEDTATCSELESRMVHIDPAELLLPATLSHATESFIRDYTSQIQRPEDVTRLERLPDGNFDHSLATRCISEFYETETSEMDSELCKIQILSSDRTKCIGKPPSTTRLQTAIHLPKTVQICFAALIRYLKDFKLEKVLQITSNFTRFSSHANYMKLSGCTLRNLEIFNNQTDGSQKGSLFWVVNHTSTPFGKRLLKKWLAQPLREASKINERLTAVTELCQSDSPCLARLTNLLTRLPDLERGLCTMYHMKCSPAEFVKIAKALAQLAQELKSCQDMAATGVLSALLKPIYDEVPEHLDGIQDFLNLLNENAAKRGDKTKLFADESKFPEIMTCNQEIQRILQELSAHRSEFRRVLRQPTLDYCCVSGNEFLIEVRNTILRSVPSEWITISSTKQVSRFRTPFVEEHYKLVCQQREQLTLACSEAWLQFLTYFNQNYARYRKAVQLIACADCLVSLATVAKQQGYVRPMVKDCGAHIYIKQGRHPIIDTILPENALFVPNDTHMDTESNRCLIVTGPNMGGKSSYIKQVALISVLAQVGSYVPAEHAEVGVLDAVYTRMGASDNIYKGRSTFMVELQEASEIIDQATSHSLVIMDELGRGTSTHDGMAIAYSTLDYFITKVQSLTLFVTHYPTLAELEMAFPKHVSNNHMAFMTSEETACSEDSTDISIGDGAGECAQVPSVTFLYQLVKGAAARSYGLNVARLAGIPEEILAVAAAKSRQLENEVSFRRSSKAVFKRLFSMSHGIVKLVQQCRDLNAK